MGLTSTAKKLQALSDVAESIYNQIQKLHQRITALEEEVEGTHNTVNDLEQELAEQRALLLALADSHDLDGETILTDAAIDDVEELATDTDESDPSDGANADE